MKKLAFAFASSLLFAFGLVVSGMTQPAKVIGFLNLGGLKNGVNWNAQIGFWDPSLALVMGGALIVTLIAFKISPAQGRKPWAAETFSIPSRRDIDAKLVIGAALFGIGWALAGYCPGPALASVLTGGFDAIAFTGAMLAGMIAAKKIS
jgi:uncharacterized protein